MTECVHKWHGNPFSTVFVCYGCPEILVLKQAEIRLNATERLSAKDARDIIGLWENSTSMRTDTYTHLLAYANILEGKDETE